jgi:hypothetical protein
VKDKERATVSVAKKKNCKTTKKKVIFFNDFSFSTLFFGL